MKSTRIFEPV